MSRGMLKLRLLMFVRHNIFLFFLGDFLGWSSLEEDFRKVVAFTKGNPAVDWQDYFPHDYELTDAENRELAA